MIGYKVLIHLKNTVLNNTIPYTTAFHKFLEHACTTTYNSVQLDKMAHVTLLYTGSSGAVLARTFWKTRCCIAEYIWNSCKNMYTEYFYTAPHVHTLLLPLN